MLALSTSESVIFKVLAALALTTILSPSSKTSRPVSMLLASSMGMGAFFNSSVAVLPLTCLNVTLLVTDDMFDTCAIKIIPVTPVGQV